MSLHAGIPASASKHALVIQILDQKCNAQWALAKDTDEIHIYYVKYPSGVVDYTAQWPKTYKTTGDCQRRQWKTTYVQR
jgi:hypothetical protein